MASQGRGKRHRTPEIDCPPTPSAVSRPVQEEHIPLLKSAEPPVPPQEFMTMYTSMYPKCESGEVHLQWAINFHDNAQLSTQTASCVSWQQIFRSATNQYTAPTPYYIRKLTDKRIIYWLPIWTELCQTPQIWHIWKADGQ